MSENKTYKTPVFIGEWSHDWAAYCEFAAAVRHSADATRAALLARARRVGAECGLGSEAPFHMAHNASVSASHGRPWRNINQSQVRYLLWLEKRSWVPSRLADRIVHRQWQRLVRGEV